MPLIGMAQIEVNRSGLKYITYKVSKPVRVKEIISDIADEVGEYGCKYFSIVKETKGAYRLGVFENLKREKFFIVLHDKEPDHSHWEVNESPIYGFEDIE